MTQPVIEYGATERTEIIDENGSTRTVEQKIHDKAPKLPVRVRYIYRHRTDNTDIATIAQLLKTNLENPHRLDVEFSIERSRNGTANGYYHLVEKYTMLEY